MSPALLLFLRGALPLLRLLAKSTATTADDMLVNFLEAIINAPTQQAAAMLKGAHAQIEHMAAQATTAAAAPAEVTEGGEKTTKKK
jgi:hypothetical protein